MPPTLLFCGIPAELLWGMNHWPWNLCFRSTQLSENAAHIVTRLTGKVIFSTPEFLKNWTRFHTANLP